MVSALDWDCNDTVILYNDAELEKDSTWPDVAVNYTLGVDTYCVIQMQCIM